jgi:hypothetical protein
MRLLFINRPSLLAGLLLILWIHANALHGDVGGDRPERQSPEQIFNKIKTTAEELARTNSAVIKAPVFRFVEETKEIKYNLGGVRVQALELEDGDPYLIPFEKQIQVEALRQIFSRVVAQEQFWQPVLQRIEGLVLETIRDIESTTSSSELQRKLDSRTTQLDTELGNLHEIIRLYADSRGYMASREGRGLASDTFIVTVVKTPSNGRVQVLPWVKYVKCNTLKKCGSSWPWRELVSESENMIGEYYYQATWPDGRRSEGKIDVRNNTTVTFSQK